MLRRINQRLSINTVNNRRIRIRKFSTKKQLDEEPFEKITNIYFTGFITTAVVISPYWFFNSYKEFNHSDQIYGERVGNLIRTFTCTCMMSVGIASVWPFLVLAAPVHGFNKFSQFISERNSDDKLSNKSYSVLSSDPDPYDQV